MADDINKWWFWPYAIFLIVTTSLRPFVKGGLTLIKVLWAVIFWAIVLIVIVGLYNYFFNKPLADPVTIANNIMPDTRLIEGLPDFGYTVMLTIKNQADHPGKVKVNVDLTCSEGSWTRTQTVVFQPHETLQLEFFFQEPTIQSQNPVEHSQTIAIRD